MFSGGRGARPYTCGVSAMKKRFKMSKPRSKRLFTNTAKFVHPKNTINSTVPMRGGIRL